MAPPKRSETVLVNELLAFVQNKLDVMDELSLEQICATSYTEAEIQAAKQYLSDTANPKHVKLVTRQREGGASRSLRDIFRTFKEEDPDDVPTYVARDLNKLPPVTFDHVDVTTLLKDIVLLKAEIAKINGKLEASERVSNELRCELTLLRGGQSASSASPPAACNVNMRRGGAAVQHDTSPLSTPVDTTNIVSSQVGDPVASYASATSAPPSPRPEPPAPSRPTDAPRTQKDAPAQGSRRRPRRKQKPAPQKEDTAALATTDSAPPKVVDEDGFTLVQNRKRRQSRNNNRRGAASVASSLKAALPTVQLYVSRLDASTTPEDVEKHVEKMWREYSQEPIEGVLVRQLESKWPTNFRSFVVRVPKFQQSVFLNAAFWPVGVVFRRYRSPVFTVKKTSQ